MADKPLILSIDQGTSSTRAIVFDTEGNLLHSAQEEFRQLYPRGGWVEHNPDEIWRSTQRVCRQARQDTITFNSGKVVAVGITNQRETTVVWDAKTGKPVYNAIVWQDRRTADVCRELKAQGKESMVKTKTGLLLDPYFSATKIAWILDNVDGARDKAEKGELRFGTTDCYLVWQLTKGESHATDATNASRTMLFNIHTNKWDEELLKLFNVPKSILPEVKNSVDDFGIANNQILGQNTPILGIAGDQQAAAIGQLCIQPGMTKSTYGTGCFMLMNSGEKAIQSKHKLLTTIAYRLNDKTSYALEGSIFNAGTAIQWLRDELQFITNAKDTEAIVEQMESNNGVYMVPAFTGLGAPHWDPDARGAVMGITRDTGPNDFVRAALESVCYQTNDLVSAMRNDSRVNTQVMRVDGGMVANEWLLQFLADILNITIERPKVIETTAIGATMLAAVGAKLFNSLEDAGQAWQLDKSFSPQMDEVQRVELIDAWQNAVNRVKTT